MSRDDQTKVPAILIAAASSGTGKTLITCGLLQLFKNREYNIMSFKCGPDYIDPMFHSRVLGIKSRNLDTFFTGSEGTKEVYSQHSAGFDLSLVEGVMGYYDGLGGISTVASAYDVAKTIEAGTILVVNAKGMSLSILAQIKGFLEYKSDNCIRGVILNRLSPMMYPRMKNLIEDELDIAVYGYVPELPESLMESRHLGLVMPNEIPKLQEKIEALALQLEKSIEVDRILQDFSVEKGEKCAQDIKSKKIDIDSCENEGEVTTVAVARDEAFCFIYEENLDLLRQMGVQLMEFSPIHDEHLPEHIHGLLLYGGYPELYAKELSENKSMRTEIKTAVENGMPCMAECGGFMYLHQTMEDMDGKSWPMAGVFSGSAYKTKKLSRFGYVTLEGGTVFGKESGPIPAHEFHYFDSTDSGSSFTAKKPLSQRRWECMHSSGNLLAGYPHLYYKGNPKVAENYAEVCESYKLELDKKSVN